MTNYNQDIIKLNFQELTKLNYNKSIFILVSEDMKLSKAARKLDEKINNLISSYLETTQSFSGKLKEKHIITTKIEQAINNIVLVGIGKNIQSFELNQVGGLILNIANSLKLDNISILVENDFSAISHTQAACLLASGLDEASYSFTKYQTLIKPEEKPKLSEVTILLNHIDNIDKEYNYYKAVNKGIFLTKNLVNEPANELNPETYASMIVEEFESYKDVAIEVLEEDDMEKLGMHSLLGVGQGSYKESKLVIIKYTGAKDIAEHISFVGKGVTFDTGGISIKPALHMEQMKYDMTGSACVVGLIKALAERNAKINVIGVVALVENMPGGNAQRPGDIVKSMSGKTIEVLNTDAEGRLILADALTYVQKNFKPKLIIDLATLTGAIGVALGNVYAGCFANDDDLCAKLLDSGKKINERLWRMPLGKEYHDMIKSDCADIANISSGSGGGSCTAAAFLEKFIDDKMVWAHLDIASVAWNSKGQKGALVSGASGFGIKLLNQLIYDNYEDKS
jgi:leucyl aminopeptidase